MPWRRIGAGLVVAGVATGVVAHEATRVEASSNGVPTVFIGDSITAADTPGATDLPGPRSWTRYVVTDDRTPWRYVANTAVAGETLGEMAARFERDVLARGPEAVVIMGGTNDVRLGLPVADSLDALRAMVESARGAGAEVWIVSPPPLDLPRWGDVGPLIEAERDLAEELDVPFVEVVPEVGAGDDRWASPGLTTDGAHPTERGAEAIAAAVLAQVD
ncbi:GDSL-type esterase/lipase family protein [Nocardioides sp. CPCC 205120]|uniref:GDSL-type esterase/lipase family protein n=1 Tax=Nocardioides sp. CPCC 205120 TaxID=3406462 RepID=UPI003B50B461